MFILSDILKHTYLTRHFQIICKYNIISICLGLSLTLEVTNDNFHGVHRLELYILIASLILVLKI